MRLFLAIDIPSPVRRLIGGVQEQLRKSIRGPIKWVDPESFHFTLKFLGEVGEDRRDEVIAAMQSIEASRFELQLSSVNQLPPEGRARVVMVDLAEIPQALQDLHEKTEFAFESLHFEREDRDFHPHLTLARLSVPRFVSRETAVELPPARFSVDEFVLMHSTLTHHGPTYQPLARRALA